MSGLQKGFVSTHQKRNFPAKVQTVFFFKYLYHERAWTTNGKYGPVDLSENEND